MLSDRCHWCNSIGNSHHHHNSLAQAEGLYIPSQYTSSYSAARVSDSRVTIRHISSHTHTLECMRRKTLFNIIGEFYSPRAGNDKCDSVKKKRKKMVMDGHYIPSSLIILQKWRDFSHPHRNNLFLPEDVRFILHWGLAFFTKRFTSGYECTIAV